MHQMSLKSSIFPCNRLNCDSSRSLWGREFMHASGWFVRFRTLIFQGLSSLLLLISLPLMAETLPRPALSCDFMLCQPASIANRHSLATDSGVPHFSLVSPTLFAYDLKVDYLLNSADFASNGIKISAISPSTSSNSPFDDNFYSVRDKAASWLIDSLNESAPLWLMVTGLTGLITIRRRLSRQVLSSLAR